MGKFRVEPGESARLGVKNHGYHVAAHRSIGDAALQAGNSESIVKRHYLNTHTQEEGNEFFRTVPDPKRRRAVLSAVPKAKPVRHLKVV